MAAVQQYRVIRLIMVLSIIGLTIFLYASYYANPTMSAISNRIQHISSSSSSSSASASLSAELYANHNDVKIIEHNYLDTSIGLHIIADVDNIQNGGSAAEQIKDDINASAYNQQQTDGINVSLAISSNQQHNGNNNNVVIGGSNDKQNSLRTVNNNGDNKLVLSLKGIPTPTAIISPAAAAEPLGSMSAVVAAIAAAQQTINISNIQKQHDEQKPHHTPIDTTKGIRTGDLYESGHTIINANLCPNFGESLRLLILITSAPQHQDARLAIRQTWGHYATRRDISIGFILGQTIATSSSNVYDDLIMAENYLYGDLIRSKFIDSYNNLTLKTISSLEWITKYCSKVSMILKTDDDMFINVPRLLQFIDKHITDHRMIYGRLAKKWKPIRNKKSKYYVSTQQYYPAIFPQFTTGPAYLMTSDIVKDLYDKSLNQTYLKLEDVFTTGIIAQLINVKRMHVNEFLNRRIAFNPCNIRKSISVHMVKTNEQFDLWKKLLDTNTKCK